MGRRIEERQPDGRDPGSETRGLPTAAALEGVADMTIAKRIGPDAEARIGIRQDGGDGRKRAYGPRGRPTLAAEQLASRFDPVLRLLIKKTSKGSTSGSSSRIS